MKYASVVLCALLLWVCVDFSYGQNWEVQYEVPSIAAIHDIEHVVDSVFVAIGIDGRMIRTEDAGLNWYSVDSHVWSTIRRVRFLNETHGWAVGEGGVILHSADGGLTWELQESGTDETLRGVEFIDEMNGWAVGWHGELLHATDGGLNWAEVDLYPDLPAVQQPDFLNIDFYDTDHGWIVGEENFRTTDGGETWEEILLSNGWLVGIQALSESTMVACGESGTIRRMEGNSVSSGPFVLSSSLRDIEFANDTIGYVVGDAGAVWQTSDGGLSWESAQTGLSNLRLNGVAFADEQQGVIGGVSYSMFRTMNYGEEWEDISPGLPPRFSSISFADQELGFCLNEQGELFKTIDGGENWISHPLATTAALYCLRFSSETDLWIAGAEGTVLYSEDAGETWNTVIVPTNGGLRDIASYGDHIWITGDNGAIVHSADNGEHWEAQDAGVNSWLSGIDFIDENNGVLVGGYSRIYFTEDGGANWIQGEFFNEINLRDVDFIDAESISCVGENGFVFVSHDRGDTWEHYLYDGDVNFYSVQFVDRLTGWAAGMQGTILQTEDGGETWIMQEIAARGYLRDICLEPPFAWIVGDGVILRSDIPSGMDDHQDAVVNNFLLSVYPNPFNSSTTLSFELPQAGRTTLQVFDITGRLVETLENRVMPSGSHSAQFEGDHLASGIYFVTLKGSTVSTTKKIVLLK